MAVNPTGPEFQVNTYTLGNQLTYEVSPQSIAMDTDGDFVVTWSSYGQDGSDYGTYGRRYNADGSAAGGEFQVNTFTPNKQRYSTVAMDNDGDFVVTWSSFGQNSGYGSGYGIYGQRYNADGSAAGGEFPVNTTTFNQQLHSSVAMDNDGDFVVTWSSYGQDGSSSGIYGQRYNADGSAAGGEFPVNTFTPNFQRYSTVAMDNDGDFVVTWTSVGQDGSGSGIYGQRYNADGSAAGGEFPVNTTTFNEQQFSTVAMDNDGDFVVTWSSYTQDGSSYGIYGRRYNADGSAAGGEFPVNTFIPNQQRFSTVAMDNDGDFVVTWSSYTQDGSSYGIYGRRYNADGSAAGGEFPVNTTTFSEQRVSSVAMDNDGDFAVAWRGFGQQDGSGYGIYGQSFEVLRNITINDISFNEGDSGTTTANFTLTLSEASNESISVDYTTADGTAEAGSDYTAENGTVTFAAGETTKTIAIDVQGDIVDEPDETFSVNLSNPTNNATITKAQGTATITDDDDIAPPLPEPSLAITDVTVVEGDSGTTNASFTVTRTGDVTGTSAVTYTTNDGSATAPSDYTPETVTLNFASSETTKTINITVKGDTIDEGTQETFSVNLSNATNAIIADGEGIGTITDDDTTNTQTGNDTNETFVATRDTDNINAAGGNDKVIANVSQLQQLDTLNGGTGRDKFVLNAGNATDTLTINANNPNDQLQGILGFGTLQNFEVFDLTNFDGSTNFTGTSLGDDFRGGAGNDTITGNDGNDSLTGGGGNDTITGGNGNDNLTGNAGIDSLIGGAGNDTYFVNDTNDKVVEAANSGLDTVRTSATFTLSDNVENLTLVSNSAINGTGNALNNTLFGNGANNILTGDVGADHLLGNAGNTSLMGGAGADILTGGTGSDKFLYDTSRAFAAADIGVDSLTDFKRGSDKIVLDKTTFTALNDGFSFARVTSDAAADNSSADVVYSSANGSTSGKLYYNTNGTADGFGSGAQFAVLTNLASPLTVSDFMDVV